MDANRVEKGRDWRRGSNRGACMQERGNNDDLNSEAIVVSIFTLQRVARLALGCQKSGGRGRRLRIDGGANQFARNAEQQSRERSEDAASMVTSEARAEGEFAAKGKLAVRIRSRSSHSARWHKRRRIRKSVAAVFFSTSRNCFPVLHGLFHTYISHTHTMKVGPQYPLNQSIDSASVTIQGL